MIDAATIENLSKIYEEKADFSRLFDYLATRRRNWAELVVDRLVDEPTLEDLGAVAPRRKVIIEFFRRLEGVGAGKLIVGRGRKKTRFRWVKQLPMLDAAAAARGSERPIEKAVGGAPLFEPNPEDSVRPQELSHQFTLRPDFVVRFHLPADLTSLEADRLSAFVKALPFDASRGGVS